jgi:ribose/xylose/arabinose/galactoside ABC-type transport system permease subunit
VTPAPRTTPTLSLRRRRQQVRVGVIGQKVIINLAIILGIWIVMGLLTPRFLSLENLTNVGRQIAVVGTVGSVVTLLMISRNFDLSIGGAAALSAAAAATLADSGWGVIQPGLPAFSSESSSVVNGMLVLKIGISSVIATLGTMYLTQEPHCLSPRRVDLLHARWMRWWGEATSAPSRSRSPSRCCSSL